MTYAHRHRDAARALNILLALDRAGSSASVAELGIFGQMLGHAGAGELRGFLTRTLGPVQAYDTSRGTDLLATLEAFLAETGQLANTARRLGIHINTLYQRLARLDEVLGADWRDIGPPPRAPRGRSVRGAATGSRPDRPLAIRRQP